MALVAQSLRGLPKPIVLKFPLANRALRLHLEEGVETSSLWFDATVERPSESRARFKMFCPGGEYDAYSLKGEAIIRQVASKKRIAAILVP